MKSVIFFLLALCFQKLFEFCEYIFNSSLPKSFDIKDIGVIIKKKINPKIIGLTIKLNIRPKFIQILLKGCKILEYVKEVIKKNKEITIKVIDKKILFLIIKKKELTKKISEKNKPNFLSDGKIIFKLLKQTLLQYKFILIKYKFNLSIF